MTRKSNNVLHTSEQIDSLRKKEEKHCTKTIDGKLGGKMFKYSL